MNDKKELRCYFGSDRINGKNNTRPGVEQRVNKEFELAGRRFVIPSVYSCAAGLAVDVIMKVDASAYFAYMKKQENAALPADPVDELVMRGSDPLAFDYLLRVSVNGRELEPASGFGLSFIPCLEYDEEESEAIEAVIAHYGLLPGGGFVFQRRYFRRSRRITDADELTAKLTELPYPVPGPEFSVEAKGQLIPFVDPLDGTERNIEAVLENVMSNELRSLEDRGAIVGVMNSASLLYRVEPEPEKGGIALAGRVGKDVVSELRYPYSFLPKDQNGGRETENRRFASTGPYRTAGKLRWQILRYPEADSIDLTLLP